MAYSYCTLFDKNYLDRGMVLVESIRKYNTCSNIYILAMDQTSYEILQAINMHKVILINLSNFETEELLKVKNDRSRGEYCWTCTASLIYYVLTKYKEEYCTYIDADMCFYEDPDPLVDEMVISGKSVQIIEHRFRNGFAGKIQEELSGRYCVQFNTFRNNEDGMKVLEDWKQQTINKCEFSGSTGHFGDQMYLEHWIQKYDCINVLKNLGAGVAPWNINRYGFLKEDNEGIWASYDSGDKVVKIIFFHFHDIHYIARNIVNINVHKRYWKLNMELVYKLYKDYLKKLEEKKEWLDREYEFCPVVPMNAVVDSNQISMMERIKRLFSGNVYKNIRFRLGNYLKIFLFGKYDIINLE